MKLKHLALAAMLSVAAPIAANAAYSYNDLQITYGGNYTFNSTVQTASAFWTVLKGLTEQNGYSAVYNYFGNVVSNLGPDLEGASRVLRVGTTRADTGWLASIDFDSLHSTIKFIGADVGGSVTATTGAVTVPGPEAGAGLGALAMGGIALYMNRRRKDEALAA